MDPDHTLRGCVHSYTGTKSHAHELLKMGFYIGFNGSGMRTDESLDVIRSVPLHRILIETGLFFLSTSIIDGPYCSITSAHSSYKHVKTHFNSKRVEKYESSCLVKGRNEPCCVMYDEML